VSNNNCLFHCLLCCSSLSSTNCSRNETFQSFGLLFTPWSKKKYGTLGKTKLSHISKVVQNTCFHLFPYRKKQLFDEGMY
jgi:hypothetical protein